MSAGIRAGSSNDGYVQVNGNDIITALSGGNVGIGNTSPSTKLHVNGTITATNFAGNISGTPTFAGDLTIPQWIIHDGDTDTKIGFQTNNTIELATTGTTRLRIGSVGEILTAGVTSEPLYPHYVTARKIQAEIKGALDVGQTRHHGSLAVNCTNSNSFIGLVRSDNTQTNETGIGVIGWSGFDGTDFHQAAAIEVIKGAGAGNNDQPGHMIFKTNAGTTSATERLRINSTGKVTIKSTAANTVAIALLDNDSTNEIWRVGQAADGDGYVEVLEDGGTVGCKLDASGNSFTMGNFGIGDASPSQLLTISHAANTTNGILIKNTNNSQASAIAQLELSGGDNSHGRVQFECNGKYSTIRHDGNGHLGFYTDGSNERLRITSTGNVAINSAGTATNLLDVRKDATSVKTHVGTINGQLGSMPNSSEYGISLVGGNGEFQLHKDGSGNYQLVLGTYQGSIDMPLVFRTDNRQERMRITKLGDVLINQPAEDSGRLTIKGTNSNGSTCYAVTNSGKAKEGIDITCTTVGNNNYGGAISFGCGGNGRSAIAAVQDGSDDDRNGLSFFTHDSNNGADDTVERLQINPDGNIKIRDPGSNAGGCLYSRFGSITNISSTSWTNILQFDNEVGVWLITVTIQTNANQHSSWAGILCKGAYDNNLTQLGSTADHYNQGYLLVQMSGDGATQYIQVKMSVTPGAGTCRCRALRLANLLG